MDAVSALPSQLPPAAERSHNVSYGVVEKRTKGGTDGKGQRRGHRGGTISWVGAELNCDARIGRGYREATAISHVLVKSSSWERLTARSTTTVRGQDHRDDPQGAPPVPQNQGRLLVGSRGETTDRTSSVTRGMFPRVAILDLLERAR